MLSLFDRVSMERALSLPLDATLRKLLTTRVSNLRTSEFDLTEYTQFLIVEPTCTEADIIDEIGLSPMVNPIDGVRFGSDAFHPFWDWLAYQDGWFEMIIAIGNSGFAYVILIQDSEEDSELVSLCRAHAS